jgi:hypothetical protein
MAHDIIYINADGEYLHDITSKLGNHFVTTSPYLADAVSMNINLKPRLLERIGFRAVKYTDCLHSTDSHWDDQR